MRVLEFQVDKQRLLKDKNCDFSRIVSGSVGYLKARFKFSSEWDGCKKAASFWVNNTEIDAALLDLNNECYIPASVTGEKKFKISITGTRPDGYSITASKFTITQEV